MTLKTKRSLVSSMTLTSVTTKEEYNDKVQMRIQITYLELQSGKGAAGAQELLPQSYKRVSRECFICHPHFV